MAKVRDCIDFDRLWNDNLDDGGVVAAAHPRARAMARHAAGCDRCRGREAAFAEVEAALGSSALARSATPEAIARWMAAASAARPMILEPAPVSTVARAGRLRNRLAAIGRRAGPAAVLAASVLFGTRLALPILYPSEAITPVAGDWATPTPFEEALGEFSTMAQDLVVKVSEPASQLGSEALNLVDSGPPPFKATQYDSPATVPPAEVDPSEPVKIELIAGSARNGFRYMTGSTADESGDSETIGGY